MRVLQVTAPAQCEVLELPVPEPGPGEILLRVEAVTTCPQWDLHLRHNEPMFPGHQFQYPYPGMSQTVWTFGRGGPR
jgi:NADPH:quinone reductase-like Zn-dependent oxidoreductase